MPTPKFQPGQRVTTHECASAVVQEVDSIAPPYHHGATGDLMPAEVWYVVRRDSDGARQIISELHLTDADPSFGS